MALFAAMLTALLVFLMSPHVAHWYLLVLTAIAAAALAMRELSVSDAFVDLRMLGGNAPLLATYGRQVLGSTATYAFVYGYTQWLESSRGLSASLAGLVLVPMFMTAIVVTTMSGRYAEVRAKLIIGSLSMTTACAALLLVGPGTAIWVLLGIGTLAGMAQGLNGLANQNALYRQADPNRMGSAAGLLRTLTYLGAISASAAIAASFAHGADTAGLHHMAVFMIASSALLVVVTVLDHSLRRPSTV